MLAQVIAEGDFGSSDTVEVSIEVGEIRTGMILSQDLITPNGLLVLKKESEIMAENLPQLTRLLQQYGASSPSIHIYRNVSVCA